MIKYIYLAILVVLVSCSSGLSDSQALKIAQNTPQFQTVEAALIRINDVNAATSDSHYVIDGARVVNRSETDEEIHHHDFDSFLPLTCQAYEGKSVNVLGNKYMVRWRGVFGGACAGCEYCYGKLSDNGLLNVETISEEPDRFGFRKVNVTLTDEGKKYLINWDDKNLGNSMTSQFLNANTGDAVAVKLMERVYTGAKKVKETDTTAEFYLQYYLDITPFGEVLYGKIPREPGFQSKAIYTKDSEGNWTLSSLENIRLNSEKREFN